MPPDGEPSSVPKQATRKAKWGDPRAITFFSEPQSLDTLNFWAMATAAFFTP